MVKSRVVIAGGGFAGAYCARRLERLAPEGTQVVLINPRNYFVFFPLLVEAATSALEPRHVVAPLRQFLRKTRLVMAQVESVDIAKQQVVAAPELGEPITFGYDHLVLALGSVNMVPDVPGLKQHGYFMKSLPDALLLRDRAIGMLEMADASDDDQRRRALLSFVVVGASYTGIEVAGEFFDFLQDASRLYPRIDKKEIRVIVVQRGGRILDTMSEALSSRAAELLTRRGLEIVTSDTVVNIDSSSATLASGRVIATHTVVWTAGIAAPPLLGELGLPVEHHGYLSCEPDLRVADTTNVWGIGDCAVNPDPDGHPYPPTAQHALQEGEQAARNIVATLRGKPTEPLVYKSKGTLTPLGGGRAIAEVFGMHFTGRIAWLMWRTVYLSKMPGLGRKARVGLDWLLDMFFRRDCSQQGFHLPHDDPP
ncbi:NADH dehydrogenase-like protein [Pirellulimonas nuda]|uniref:NADH:ubiquinone reductase (non-electrogenic) n=1 Tax=Pirellulimonas nuda TaxID=2528009 RepID=A0A518D8X9_9BACT|nr:NAD(P)/FAD-dependent oxidoreductase [Pirellulimonas nuda]QDU87904.1 NADH dehydrogenase-like protein [Pirellulimonas nuda]